jgi:uncharacterized protein YerC
VTNISKIPLDNTQLNQLFAQLSTCIGNMHVGAVDGFLTDLLGAEERIMIAKRLAAIILLLEGHSIYRTAQILHLSTSTVTHLSRQLLTGDFSNIVSLFKKEKKDYLGFLDVIDSILHAGGIMPHRDGLERYRGLK